MVQTTAIVLYPIGLLLLNAALLFSVRRAICSEEPTALSTAIAFLHREYDVRRGLYWWECAEMLRRFVLVGLLVFLDAGSMMQIVTATLFCKPP